MTSLLLVAAAASPLRAGDPAPPPKPDTSTQPKLPRPAPNISLRMGGSDLTLADFRGGVLLVTFWATWSKPSVKLLPHLESLQKKYSTLGFTVLGISVDEDPAAPVKYLKKKSPGFPLTVDGGDPSARQSFGAPTIPTVYLIDRDGVIRSEWAGDAAKSGDIGKAVEALVGEPTSNR
jgi:thiol-disulfide isomerase/thioredoxin